MPRVRDWAAVLTSGQTRLAAWHQFVINASTLSPDIPGRASILDSLLARLTQIIFDCASDFRSPGGHASSRRRQPSWWNDACYHALVARNGAWRDLQRSGSNDDFVRFRHMRQQFHTVVRSSRSSFWDGWLSTVDSLSRRDPRLASSHIRRTFRSSAVSPDLCNMQWPNSDHRSVVPSCDARTHWRTHFASSTSTSDFCEDFFASISRRFATLTRHRDHGRFDAPFTYNELAAALSRCHESAPPTLFSKCTSLGGVIYSFLFSTSFYSGPSCLPLGNRALWSHSSNGMAIRHPQIPIDLSPSLPVRSRSLSTRSTPASHHTFSRSWTSAKVVSGGALTSWHTASWIPCVFAV